MKTFIFILILTAASCIAQNTRDKGGMHLDGVLGSDVVVSYSPDRAKFTLSWQNPIPAGTNLDVQYWNGTTWVTGLSGIPTGLTNIDFVNNLGFILGPTGHQTNSYAVTNSTVTSAFTNAAAYGVPVTFTSSDSNAFVVGKYISIDNSYSTNGGIITTNYGGIALVTAVTNATNITIVVPSSITGNSTYGDTTSTGNLITNSIVLSGTTIHTTSSAVLNPIGSSVNTPVYDVRVVGTGIPSSTTPNLPILPTTSTNLVDCNCGPGTLLTTISPTLPAPTISYTNSTSTTNFDQLTLSFATNLPPDVNLTLWNGTNWIVLIQSFPSTTNAFTIVNWFGQAPPTGQLYNTLRLGMMTNGQFVGTTMTLTNPLIPPPTISIQNTAVPSPYPSGGPMISTSAGATTNNNWFTTNVAKIPNIFMAAKGGYLQTVTLNGVPSICTLSSGGYNCAFTLDGSMPSATNGYASGTEANVCGGS